MKKPANARQLFKRYLKSITYAIVFLLILSTLSGCTKTTATLIKDEKVLPVEVINVKEDSQPVKLSYLGVTGTGELKKYSFKIPGKLSGISVSKGDSVKAGQKLAELSTTERSLDLDNSRMDLHKAELAYDNAKDTYSKLQTLYPSGAITKNDLDKAKLDMDIKETTLNQAKAGVSVKESALKDSVLYSDMQGYVVDVLFKSGEVLNAGYPVVVVRAAEQLVNVGLSLADVSKIHVGTTAEVIIEGDKTEGTITKIDQVPDAQSRTFNAEIKLVKPLAEEKFYLGASAKVNFDAGTEKGLWIPIASILNDGEDYVYVVQGDRIVKKNIHLLNTQAFMVRVEGLMAGDKLVTSGMKEVKEGSKVSVKEGTVAN